MIPSFLKVSLPSSATVAAVSNLALYGNPDAFRSAALTWIAVSSVVVFAALAAISQALPKVFALIEKFDDFAAKRAAKRLNPTAPIAPTSDVDTPAQAWPLSSVLTSSLPLIAALSSANSKLKAGTPEPSTASGDPGARSLSKPPAPTTQPAIVPPRE